MDSDKKPNFIHLVIALESVVLLAFLLMLTPIGGRLTLSENVRPAENVRSAENGEAENGASENGEAEKQEKTGGGNAEEAESAGKEGNGSSGQESPTGAARVRNVWRDVKCDRFAKSGNRCVHRTRHTVFKTV